MPSNLPQQYWQRASAFLHVVIVAAAFSAGCVSQKNGNANVAVSNTGMTNTNTSGSSVDTEDITIRGLDDRPIHISGGSLELDFDKRDYRLTNPAPAGKIRFSSRGLTNRITDIALFDDAAQQPCDLPPDFPRILRLTYQGGTASEPVVVIKDNTTCASGVKSCVDVELTLADLPYRPGQTRRHYNAVLRIQSLDFLNSAGTPINPNPCPLPSPSPGVEKKLLLIVGTTPPQNH